MHTLTVSAVILVVIAGPVIRQAWIAFAVRQSHAQLCDLRKVMRTTITAAVQSACKQNPKYTSLESSAQYAAGAPLVTTDGLKRDTVTRLTQTRLPAQRQRVSEQAFRVHNVAGGPGNCLRIRAVRIDLHHPFSSQDLQGRVHSILVARAGVPGRR